MATVELDAAMLVPYGFNPEFPQALASRVSPVLRAD